MRSAGALAILWLLVVTACVPLRSVLAPSENGEAAVIWRELAPGLELAQLSGPGALSGRVTALRIAPARYDFRLHYRPEEPLSAEGWRAELPAASAIINANFYDTNGRALGWLVMDGAQQVFPHPRFGGAFVLVAGEAHVLPRLPSERLADQAAQGFPTLVRAGQAAARLEGAVLARRSVIAEDDQGRILFVLVGGLGSTLAALGEWLAEGPLEIANAVNMDGGGSTMLVLPADESAQLRARDAVPAVLAIYPSMP